MECCVLYRIKDWASNYENNRTKEMVTMQWVPLKNRHDGDGYTELLSHKNGPALFGAWVVVVQVASRCEPRGTLIRDNQKPHDATSLARMTRFPVDVIEEMLKVVSSDEVGWLEVDGDAPAEGHTPSPQEDAPIPHPTDEEGKEGREEKEDSGEAAEPPSPPALPGFPCVGTKGGEYVLTVAKVEEYRLSFPGVDVLSECKKARQWCIDNPTKRKTLRGMPAFLTSWLSRTQDRGKSFGPAPPVNGRKGLTTFAPLPQVAQDVALEALRRDREAKAQHAKRNGIEVPA